MRENVDQNNSEYGHFLRSVKSPRYFAGQLNPSLHKSEVYIKKCCRSFSCIPKTYVWNKSFTNFRTLTLFRFPFTNSGFETFQLACMLSSEGTRSQMIGPKYLIELEPWQSVITVSIGLSI